MFAHVIFIHDYCQNIIVGPQYTVYGLLAGFQKERLLPLFLAKDSKNLGIGIENPHVDGFFGSLIKRPSPTDPVYLKNVKYIAFYWLGLLKYDL